jgi:hypothetical protein
VLGIDIEWDPTYRCVCVLCACLLDNLKRTFLCWT